jgi:diguanylate cyclase (GGDEF)-like protein
MAFHILQLAGLLLLLLRGRVPDVASIVLANAAIIGGGVICVFGLARFTETRVHRPLNYAFLTAFLALYVHFGLVAPSLTARIVCLSLGIMLVSAQAMDLLFRQVPLEMRRNYRLASWTFLLYFVFNGLRIVLAVLRPTNTSFFGSAGFDPLFVIIDQLLAVVLTFGLVLMINGRLAMEVNRYTEVMEMLVQELGRLAVTDGLTGIFNRMKMDEILKAEVLRSRRYGRPLSAILIDVDFFKAVNDTLGHQAGDTVLKHIAAQLQGAIRECDFIGRWGGEEFLVVNPETPTEGAVALAEKLRSFIADHPLSPAGRTTVSMGVATLLPDERLEDMLRRADEALYRAKAAGRNRVEV